MRAWGLALGERVLLLRDRVLIVFGGVQLTGRSSHAAFLQSRYYVLVVAAFD